MKKRFNALVCKLLSVKFVIFLAASAMRIWGYIGCSEWLWISLIVVAGREGEKCLKMLIENGGLRGILFRGCEEAAGDVKARGKK